MSWKQRIYDLLLPLPEQQAPAPSAFSDAARIRHEQEQRDRYFLEMEVERLRGVRGV